MVYMVTAVDPPNEPQFTPVTTDTSTAGKILKFGIYLLKRIVFF
jgi:hypothetical protein